LDFEEAERRAEDYVKKRLDAKSVETLSVRYDKNSEEFTIAFTVTDKQEVKRLVRVKYDKDGTQTGYELKKDKASGTYHYQNMLPPKHKAQSADLLELSESLL